MIHEHLLPGVRARVSRDAGGAIRATCVIAADHPDYDGHFDERPVMPACSQFEILEAIARRVVDAGLRFTGAPRVKFLGVIAPGDAIDVALTPVAPVALTPVAPVAPVALTPVAPIAPALASASAPGSASGSVATSSTPGASSTPSTTAAFDFVITSNGGPRARGRIHFALRAAGRDDDGGPAPRLPTHV